jgi:hypothetical protein
MFPDGDVVKSGTFLYAGSVVCDVCIQRTDCRYGSGDYEDPPEIRDDLEGEWFYLWLSPAGSRGQYITGAGGCPTIIEAMRHAEQQLEGLRWLDDSG